MGTTLETLVDRPYAHGFFTTVETDAVPKGLSEDVIRTISARKSEPAFMLDWRLKAYRHWLTMTEPQWATVKHPRIDYQDIVYYSAPKANKDRPKSLEEVDPELLRTYDRLGVPLKERELLAGVAVDAVFDSVSVATTFKEKLSRLGIIFCPFSEAVQKHPDLVRRYLGSVVPYTDNFFATLNSAVFSDGSFCYIPPGVRCPVEKEGRGGIYNFVTKRGDCREANSRISWTQVETGSAITWKYPSVVLQGDNSVGEFYSVALTNNYQQADTGTKMTHLGRNTRSTILSKGIAAGHGRNAYRGLVKVANSAVGARNYTQCDSLLLGDQCAAHTFPYIEVKHPSAKVEHEASTSRIGEDQLFYCMQRGLSSEDAVSMIVNGFCREVFKELPMEFAVEAQKLLGVSLEGSVG